MYRLLVLLLASCLLQGCNESIADTEPAKNDKLLTSYVNPFIGTGGHGHTYPGATLPFGMMQLSPDTRLDGWDGCSGYHYSDNYIYGFSHTHLSGTGVSDYGDVLLMPTHEVVFNNGANGKKGYRAHFSHENEEAAPGFYKVLLDSTNIHVELTVSKRSGIHRYSFPKGSKQVVILDLTHRDKVLDSKITVHSNNEISGHRHSSAWATNQRLYFNMYFSRPFKKVTFLEGAREGEKVKAAFEFDSSERNDLEIKVGISPVDEAGARKNLQQEIGNAKFQEVVINANNSWEKQLQKIVIEHPDEDVKANFYTALYHTMIAPNLYQDVDGRYRGMDLEIHQTIEFDYYTVFSLWDTYRAAHPLYTIIEAKRTNDFIRTMLAKFEEGGILPIWDLSANYTGCMIGYHGVPVIADAYIKGIRDYDAEKALKAMIHSASENHLGLESYKKLGFIPVEEESESVSKTLEYAYDDWTIAVMAEQMGKNEVAAQFYRRAQAYKNVYNPETGFMQGRFRNTWFGPFDPYEVNFNYTEANAWQYSLYVPQDLGGLMKLMGGKVKLEAHLDDLFTAQDRTSGREQADITGLIGQYAHGNEPSHHMAYLYNFVNKPHKTQEKVRQILTELYSNTPDGISGNEDCGQMSAWYIFSALGFYPVTPGSSNYIIGSPLIEKASLYMDNGNRLTIVATGASEDMYISQVLLNGKPLGRSYITHDEIIKGGTLEYLLNDQPTPWGTTDAEIPSTSIDNNSIIPAPFISKGSVAFKERTWVELGVALERATIYFGVNTDEFQIYKEPIQINENSTLRTYAERNGIRSELLETQFYKIDPNRTISLMTEYANQYNAGGNEALIDGIRGARDFRTGAWQGYQGTDVIAIVDLGSIQPIEHISVNFLQDQRSWIFLPTEVACLVSNSPGNNYKALPKTVFDSKTPSEEILIKTATFNMKDPGARYIKIIAKNLGALPKWHLGYPYNGKAWIFIDEIEIKHAK